jgi:F-type H+-transporting ATPase subunit b
MEDTLNHLGIDWRELLAQVINFGIILFVLSKWAYGPVIAMLNERRKRIEESMANADKIKVQLAETQKARQVVLDQANVHANKLIEEARAAAARVQEQETQKAVTQAEQIIAKANEATKLEHARMLTDLKREIGTLVVRTTGVVTGKVLTPEDQRRLAEETQRQLTA